MFRKTIHLLLLLLVLVPALTGWAGDRCCPSDAPSGGAACEEHPSEPAPAREAADHHNTDPGHQQALCSCACHVLCMTAVPAPLGVPALLCRIETPPARNHSSAHLSDIFHPPLA